MITSKQQQFVGKMMNRPFLRRVLFGALVTALFHQQYQVHADVNDNTPQPALRRLKERVVKTDLKVNVVIKPDKSSTICNNDLGIRFNKVGFKENLYLSTPDYPMEGSTAQMLQIESTAVSVVTKDDWECQNVNITEFIEAIGGYPSFPCSNPESDFWTEFRDVVEIQIMRRNNDITPDQIMKLPVLWNGMDIHEVAEAVHTDFPGYHHTQLLQQLLSLGLELDYDILPFRSYVDFVGTQVRLGEMIACAVGMVAPGNFLAKWYVGRPRPEEVAYQITVDELTEEDGVPSDVVDLVKSMNLERAEDFTAYPEGCPRHPSWPAMHSAASAISLWLPLLTKMSPQQYCQTLLMDHAVAFGRTVAGVHYRSDNIAGLNLGQEILARRLPEYLAKRYGSNQEDVEKKIQSLRFDWNTFDQETCTVKYTNRE